MQQAIPDIRKAVKQKQPLIHCITNPISINQCANGILAIGARPMMAEHPGEVSEITRTARALMLNLGNITDARMESILLSAETAKEQGPEYNRIDQLHALLCPAIDVIATNQIFQHFQLPVPMHSEH